MTAVSLNAVKAYLNLTNDRQDDEVIETVDRAEAILVKRVGPLSPTVVTETRENVWPLVLGTRPVQSVQSVSGAASWRLNAAAGVLYGRGVSGMYDTAVTVTYTAGWPAPLPADLEAGLLELVKHLWDSQRVPMSSGRPGFGGEDYNPEVPASSRYLLPYRVQTLIEPYLLRRQVA